ncbi:MAG: glutathione S-transferase family protein [Pseudomonadales bacterium]|nr:glutathione S-transferase family protein [Pseudomonadales bacterium]MCP5329610.1 glutathione S-transferase family protein [Pseudomonadales bacterium]MCP5343851.1 glutathione S-transferase family protein [Pseudomonadales bacterium]
MALLTFYTNPQSRGQIVRWMLEETGIEYEVEVLQYGGSMKAPEYLAINPMGKVPAIRHRGTVVTEVAAICAYLADAFPDAGLAPAVSDPLRGTYYRWLFFAAGPLEMAVTVKAMKWEAPAERQGTLGYGNEALTLNALEGAIAGKSYLCGEQFTAADVYVGSALRWGMLFGTIDKRAVFEAYVSRLEARPALQRAIALDAALIPKPE